MAEEFVRKEVYETDLKRVETLLEKNLAEFKAIASDIHADVSALRGEFNTFRAEVRADVNEIRGDVSALRGEFNTFRAEVRADVNEIRGEVRVLAEHIGTLEAHITTMEYWGAIIIGAATIAFGLAQYFHSKRETIAAKVREEVNELRKTVLMLVDAGKIAAAR